MGRAAVRIGWVLLVLACASAAGRAPAADAPALYAKHCAQCHGADRLGMMGPALLPENLKRVRRKQAAKVIAASGMAPPTTVSLNVGRFIKVGARILWRTGRFVPSLRT